MQCASVYTARGEARGRQYECLSAGEYQRGLVIDAGFGEHAREGGKLGINIKVVEAWSMHPEGSYGEGIESEK